MKNIILILSFFGLLNTQYSFVNAQQNLVPNGGFEQFTQCPNSTAQLSYCNNWNFAGASTDYYNSCSPQGNMSIPLNTYGYQEAFEGNAYIGMITSVLNDDNLFYYREPVISNLTQTLQIGTKYYVSFKAVLTINNFESCCASNNLGALFSTTFFTPSNPVPTDLNFAHIYTNSVITDTSVWTKISGSFTADSTYEYITIGNFFDSLNTTMIDYNQNFPATSSSYYYIDDVRVSTDSLYGLNLEELEENNLIVKIYPNPASDYLNINQTFSEFYDLNIYNALGQNLYEERNISLNFKTINVESFSRGIFIINIKSNNRNFNYKLIKQ